MTRPIASSPLAPRAATAGLRARLLPLWQRLAPRERRAIATAAAAIALALWWSLLIQPAWRAWRAAPAQLARAQAELATMRSQAAQAQALQAQGRRSAAERLAALQSVTASTLGERARAVRSGDSLTIHIDAAPPEALARWLADVRTAAQATPSAVQWQRSSTHWQGSARFELEP